MLTIHHTNRRRPLSLSLAAAVACLAMLAGPGTAVADPCSNGGDGQFGCGLDNDGGSGGGGGGSGGGGSGGGGTNDLPDLGQDGEQGGLGGDDGGGAAPPPPPPTAQLAEAARASAQLPAPTVHTAPSGKTYVRLDTRLWVDGFAPVSTDPISIGDQTVVATATPKSVTWNLGETTITCDGPGSPDGNTCSHAFQRSSASGPGGAYQITATITFGLTWTCAGPDCDAPGGSLDDLSAPSAPEPLVVSEIQTNSRP